MLCKDGLPLLKSLKHFFPGARFDYSVLPSSDGMDVGLTSSTGWWRASDSQRLVSTQGSLGALAS